MSRRQSAEGSPKRPGFFRGSEGSRLLILSAVVIAGWIVVLKTANRPAAEPPAQVRVEDSRPIVADTSIDFQAVRDKAPLNFRENAAYATLLDRARGKTPDELANEARSDLLFTHFWERPEKYRGVPARLEGTALKVLTYEVNPKLVPKGRVYEVWFVTGESRRYPYAIVVEDPPEGLPVGDNLNERIVADGYFFKLLGYAAGDAARAAPLVVGKLLWFPRKEGPVGGGQGILQSINGVIGGVLALLVVYVGFRMYFQYRRLLGGAGRVRTVLDRSSRDEAEPEVVEDFLRDLEEGGDRPEEGAR